MKIELMKITAICLSLGIASMSTGSAEVVISDSFTLSSSRTSGTTINGLTTETGNKTWVTGTNWVLGGSSTNGYITSNANSNSTIAVSFTPSSYSSYGTLITLSADVAYIKSSGSAFFLTLGRASSNVTTNGLLYLKINPYGDTWSLCSGSSTVTGGTLSDYISTYSASTLYNYSISYDTSTKYIDISINGKSVLSDYYFDYTTVFTSGSTSISNLFIYTQYPGSTSQSKIDNFSVSVVPEASSAKLGVLGLGILLLTVLRKRRQ
jgi:hypothetical protein